MPQIVQAHVPITELRSDFMPQLIEDHRTDRRTLVKEYVLRCAGYGGQHFAGSLAQPNHARPRLAVRQNDLVAFNLIPSQMMSLSQPATRQSKKLNQRDTSRISYLP